MRTITAKTQILEDGGYAYNFDREIYVNRKDRRVFSLECVEDKSEGWLKEKINAPALQTGKWDFNFSREPPSPGVERALSEILG